MGILKRILGRDPGEATPQQGGADLGPFERIAQGYITLLDLDRLATGVIETIAEIVHGGDARLSRHIERLLADANWRPQLIGALATLCTARPADFVPATWDAFDRGSWVAPQLAVVLFHADSQFAEAAKARVLAGCPLAVPSFESSLHRHVAAGSASTPECSAKNLAALLALLSLLPHQENWMREVMSRPDVRDLHALDRDNSGELALRWRLALSDRFTELQLPLPSAAV